MIIGILLALLAIACALIIIALAVAFAVWLEKISRKLE